MTDELNAGEVVVMIPKAELDALRAHDKEATALTIDQQVEIGRLSLEVDRLRARSEWLRRLIDLYADDCQ